MNVKSDPDPDDCESADARLLLVLSDTERTVTYEPSRADTTAGAFSTGRIEYADLTDPIPHLEDADEARARATRMEAVWNVIWWRRIVYLDRRCSTASIQPDRVYIRPAHAWRAR